MSPVGWRIRKLIEGVNATSPSPSKPTPILPLFQNKEREPVPPEMFKSNLVDEEKRRPRPRRVRVL